VTRLQRVVAIRKSPRIEQGEAFLADERGDLVSAGLSSITALVGLAAHLDRDALDSGRHTGLVSDDHHLRTNGDRDDQ